MSKENLINAKKVLQRVKTALDITTDTQLANYLGKDPSTVSSWKSRNTLDYDQILAICHKMDFDYSWIFFGIPTRDEALKIQESQKKIPLGVEKVAIPVYASIRASAGDGIIPEVEKDLIYIGMPRTFIYDELHTTPANLFVMPIRGDSMEPTIKNGDYIIVNKQVGRPLAGHIFLVRIDESILCKRLHELPSKRLRVSSDNQYYESFEIPADQDNFEIIGRVVWFSRQI